MNKKFRCVLCVYAVGAVCLCIMTPNGVCAQDEQTDSAITFESFRILIERNIFDPDRRKRMSVVELPVEAPPTERIVLIGTMIDGGEAYAFFDGTKSEYEAAVRLREAIAGYRVTEIDTDHVKLDNGGRQISLPVGMGLVREGEGNWQIASASLPAWSDRSRSTATESTTGATDKEQEAESGKSQGDSIEDVLKKLMEKRKQELQR